MPIPLHCIDCIVPSCRLILNVISRPRVLWFGTYKLKCQIYIPTGTHLTKMYAKGQILMKLCPLITLARMAKVEKYVRPLSSQQFWGERDKVVTTILIFVRAGNLPGRFYYFQVANMLIYPLTANIPISSNIPNNH